MNMLATRIKTFLSIYYAYMLEYRAELLLWVLANSLPLIMMGVWSQAAEGGQFSLTSLDVARYFIAVFIVRQFTIVWVIWDFEREVVEGKLSPRLLQPIDPVWHHVAGHVSERLARLPFSAGLVILFFILYPQAFWLPSPMGLIWGCIATVLAFTLRFIIQYTFALFAFWVERATAIEQLWFLFYLFLSGMIAPLDLFPDTVRAIIVWTPFPYLIYFPVSLFVGLPTPIAKSFLVMLLWCGLGLVINRWLWRRGIKQYSGMGA
ncbi:ABC-2 family transporter protein [Acaryochloris sp. IP29b_bin.137]|uniref:ABC transporter permease n=1 Tax=Acaryochloris sp. IP29b_bin.137 TaxID=2969217 RepID=UPI0026151BCF|nr:ABC-2 family transporter protein [Acaryochloris sp. IP29b_bin.137]